MSDYNFLMETRLSPEQFRLVSLISRIAAEEGLNIYLVGGAIRDLTFGQQIIRDLDFAVQGNPHDILRRIQAVKPGADSLDPIISHADFDSRLTHAEVTFQNGVRASLAMCRTEAVSRPGGRPGIQPGTIFEDLGRRDFSINAMAVSLHPNSRGLLLDPTNGALDIERKELRSLSRYGFSEDPLRILRLLRFASRLDFKAEERTQSWLDAALHNNVLENLRDDQRATELRAILHEEQPNKVLKMLAERKLLGYLDKKLAGTRIAFDVLSKIRSVSATVQGSDPFLVNFHCVTGKIGVPDQARLAKELLKDPRDIKTAAGFEKEGKKLAKALSGSKAAHLSHVYEILAPQPKAMLLYLLVYQTQSTVQKRVKDYLQKAPEIRARLPHSELQALGVNPGPQFDRIMDRIFREQLDGVLKTPQQVTKALREYAGVKDQTQKPAREIERSDKGFHVAGPTKSHKKSVQAAKVRHPLSRKAQRHRS
jgi:tRNA nucleotidyltransferase (CCA-adding enzyme)